MRKLTFALATAVTALLAAACHDAAEPGPATKPEFDVSGSDFQCVGFVAGGTFDNVVVPPGQHCVLALSFVRGNVKALENSLLEMSGVTVGGNVDGDKATHVELHVEAGRNLVRGSIQIKEAGLVAAVCGTDLPEGNIQLEKNTGLVLVGGTICAGATFGSGNTLEKGNIKVEENTIPASGSLQIVGNSVGGDVQVFKNRGPGTKLVQNNSVGQSLQCFENEAPFVGGPNAAGKAEGQCF